MLLSAGNMHQELTGFALTSSCNSHVCQNQLLILSTIFAMNDFVLVVNLFGSSFIRSSSIALPNSCDGLPDHAIEFMTSSEVMTSMVAFCSNSLEYSTIFPSFV